MITLVIPVTKIRWYLVYLYYILELDNTKQEQLNHNEIKHVIHRIFDVQAPGFVQNLFVEFI